MLKYQNKTENMYDPAHLIPSNLFLPCPMFYTQFNWVAPSLANYVQDFN